MEQSKYGKYSRKRVPRHRRSQIQSGAFEDRDAWIRCWNCGFVNRVDRISGNPEVDGRYYTLITYPTPADVGNGGFMNSVPVYKHDAIPGGCAFCGTMNLP